DRFLISLPISNKSIVYSKYLFLYFMIVMIIFLQGITMLSTTVIGSSQYTYDWQDIIVLLCTATIILAIIIPIFHLFKSMILATGVVIVLFITGFFLVMNRIIYVMDLQDTIIFNDLD